MQKLENDYINLNIIRNEQNAKSFLRDEVSLQLCQCKADI